MLNTECEMRCATALSNALVEIKQGLVTPVGIIVFGADCKFKEETVTLLLRQLGINQDPDLDEWKRDYEYPECYMKTENHLRYRVECGVKYHVLVLNGENSVDLEIRQGFVRAMMNAGISNVVGFYTHARPVGKVSPQECTPELCERNEQINALLANPPVAEEFDCLVIRKEKE